MRATPFTTYAFLLLLSVQYHAILLLPTFFFRSCGIPGHLPFTVTCCSYGHTVKDAYILQDVMKLRFRENTVRPIRTSIPDYIR